MAEESKNELNQSRTAIADLLDRTNVKKPDPQDVAELQELLEQHPELWMITGDLAKRAASRMIEQAGSTALVKESIKKGLQEMRRELGYDSAPMLERLLIEHVVICWLQTYIIQCTYTAVHSESVTLKLGDYWERRLSAVQGRYLRAVETLARVRRLARVSPLQVNIGGQQVNMIGTGPGQGAVALPSASRS